MAYITDQELETKLDIPVNLPLTQLEAGDWLIVATFNIPSGTPTVKATLRILQIQMTFGVLGDSGGIALHKNYNILNPPTVGAVELITVAGPAPTISARNPNLPLTLDGRNAGVPGTYYFVAFNSSVNPIKLIATGGVRIDINPA